MSEFFLQKRVLVAAAATAVFTWLYDFVVHANLLMDIYMPYAQMFRPMDQMQEFMPFCVAYHVALALVFAAGFHAWRDKIKVGKVGTSECPYRKAMKFGLWVGALLAIPQAMTYVWLPFDTANLPLAWAASELVKWSIAGLIVSKLYKKA